MNSLKWVVALLLVAGVAQAQFNPREVGFGVAGGFAMAMYEDILDESRNDPGAQIGFTMTYEVQPNINTRFTLGYGYFLPREEDVVSSGVDATLTTTLSDIFLDAESNYFFTDEFYGLLGVSINFYKLNYETELANGTVSEDNRDGTNTGVDIGLGYMVNPTTGIELKYALIPDIAQVKLGVIYLFRPPAKK